MGIFYFFFFFQAEDGIRDGTVTGVQTCALPISLLLKEIQSGLRAGAVVVLVALVLSALLAALVSGITLAPLRDITAQLDRISSGQFDAASSEAKTFESSGDELGLVSRKISQVGQQLLGVHEIFSTMRENMNSEIGRASCREKCRSRWSS